MPSVISGGRGTSLPMKMRLIKKTLSVTKEQGIILSVLCNTRNEGWLKYQSLPAASLASPKRIISTNSEGLTILKI
jgi:hypothetical protein